MVETLSCSECGNPIGSDTGTFGLCPRCLMGQALGLTPNPSPAAVATEAESDGPDAATTTAPAPDVPDLEMLDLLGQGGMGTVYKARQRGLDRLVAVKVFPAHLAHDPSFVERFHQEARVLASLSHPNIVTAYGFGRSGDRRDGRLHLVMEYVRGPSLRQVLADGPLPQNLALRIAEQVCDALQYAHGQGIVHRDIKPENLLLQPGPAARPGDMAGFFDAGGRVRVADFGLSRLMDRRASDYSLTSPEHRLGTPYYMAPEQRERPRLVDERADIYSLGVVLYEMLTGELPLGRFPDPSAARPGVDARVDAVVLRCLEKDPLRRYPSAADLRRELAALAAEVHAPPPLAYRAPPPGSMRQGFRPLVIALVAVAAVFVVLAGLAALVIVRKGGATPLIVAAPAPRVVAPAPPPFGPFGGRDPVQDMITRHGTSRVVTVRVDNLPGDVGSFVADTLQDITGAGSVASSRSGRSMTVYLAPVAGNVRQVADRIKFGKVTQVDEANRTIDVEATAAAMPPPLPPAVTNPNDSNFFPSNLADLSSRDAGRRRQALERFKSVPPTQMRMRKEIAAAMTERLSDEDTYVRRSAAEALAKWGGADAVPALNKALADPDWTVRRAVLASLGTLGDASSAEPAAALLATDRYAAAECLRRIGPVAEPAVLAQLETADGQLTSAALDVLEKIGTEQSLPALEQMAAGEDFHLSVAAKRTIKAIEQRVRGVKSPRG